MRYLNLRYMLTVVLAAGLAAAALVNGCKKAEQPVTHSGTATTEVRVSPAPGYEGDVIARTSVTTSLTEPPPAYPSNAVPPTYYPPAQTVVIVPPPERRDTGEVVGDAVGKGLEKAGEGLEKAGRAVRKATD